MRKVLLCCIPIYPLLGAAMASPYPSVWRHGRLWRWAIGQILSLIVFALTVIIIRANANLDTLPAIDVVVTAYLVGLPIAALFTWFVVTSKGDLPSLKERGPRWNQPSDD